MSKQYQQLLVSYATNDIDLRRITDRAVIAEKTLGEVIADLNVIRDTDSIAIAMAYEASTMDDSIYEVMNWQQRGVFRLTDIHTELLALKRNPKSDEGLKLGWNNVKMTLKPEIYTITGIPGSGKSAWLDNLMMNSIRQHGLKWAVFSPEQLPVQNHVKTLIEIATNSNFYGKYNTRETNEEAIQQALNVLNDHLFFLNPPDDNALKIENILGLIEEQVYEFGVNAFILDPYNEFSHTRPQKISETEYVSHFFQKIRRFVKKHNCMCMLVAHPTKLRKLDDGTYPIPTAYDIAGSANFYNKSDQIMVVHREKDRKKNPNNTVQIIVQKVKHKGTGEIGMYELEYNYGDGTYKDAPRYDDTDVPEYYNK